MFNKVIGSPGDENNWQPINRNEVFIYLDINKEIKQRDVGNRVL